MGTPQQTSTPPPASTTFTLLPQILQTYTCPTSVAILVLLKGFWLLTPGTKAPEGQRWVFNFKAVPAIRRQKRKFLRLPVKVDDAVALPADKMGMWARLPVVARHFVQGVYLDHHAFLTQDFQSFVHGVKGNGWKLPAHLLINIFRRGVVPTVLQTAHHRQSLGSHRNAAVTQFLNEIFHILIKPNYQIIIITVSVKGETAVSFQKRFFFREEKSAPVNLTAGQSRGEDTSRVWLPKSSVDGWSLAAQLS
jgi:hypothetical protein